MKVVCPWRVIFGFHACLNALVVVDMRCLEENVVTLMLYLYQSLIMKVRVYNVHEIIGPCSRTKRSTEGL